MGAYLTQNTSWGNVEIAMSRLRSARVLSVAGIRRLSLPKLESLIRSSGYFRQKAQRLKTFVTFLDQNYGGSLKKIFLQPTSKLREELLSLNGVGQKPPTQYSSMPASIPSSWWTLIQEDWPPRHRILPENAPYEDFRVLFERALAVAPLLAPGDSSVTSSGGASHRPSRISLALRVPLAQTFNEMHGLIVGVGKKYCVKSNPRCDQCPLRRLLPGA